MTETDRDQLSEVEAARRWDEALRRAMTTPPTPHKPISKATPKPEKRTAGKGRARVGKAQS